MSRDIRKTVEEIIKELREEAKAINEEAVAFYPVYKDRRSEIMKSPGFDAGSIHASEIRQLYDFWHSLSQEEHRLNSEADAYERLLKRVFPSGAGGQCYPPYDDVDAQARASLQRKREFMNLPIEERRRIMKEQADNYLKEIEGWAWKNEDSNEQ